MRRAAFAAPPALARDRQFGGRAGIVSRRIMLSLRGESMPALESRRMVVSADLAATVGPALRELKYHASAKTRMPAATHGHTVRSFF